MTTDIAGSSEASRLITRIESVPFSRWHVKPRIIVGSATFFDAFDALQLASVLIVIRPAWGLSISAVGGTPESAGFSGKWSRTSDVIHFSDGEGYEYTSTMRGDTLGMSCFGPNLICNYTKR